MSLRMLDIVLAGLNVDRSLRAAITGDLLEERAAVATVHGERSADRWMRHQIVLAVLEFVRAAVCDGGVRRLGAIVGAACAAMVAIGLSIGASSTLWFALLSPETIARLAILALAIDLAFGTAGGYLAARLGRASPLGAAFAFGMLALALTLMSGAQGWYRLALLLLLIPASLTGGWLRARYLSSRSPG